MSDYHQQARDLAAQILALPAHRQAALLDHLTDADHQQQAIDDGNWSLYALLVTVRMGYEKAVAQSRKI
jgi:hypothetical protein